MKNKKKIKKDSSKTISYSFKHLFSRRATLRYPASKVIVEKNYRGKLVFSPAECDSCSYCMRSCPTQAVQIVNRGSTNERNMECYWNAGRCIFCNLCVESCKYNCLRLSNDIDLSVKDKKDMVYKL